MMPILPTPQRETLPPTVQLPPALEARLRREREERSFGPYWTVARLAEDDRPAAKIREALAARFRTSRKPPDAERIARPFLTTPLDSAERAYKAATALYYLGVVNGQMATEPDSRRVWTAFVKYGQPQSPEYARTACDFVEMVKFGRVRVGTALPVLQRFSTSSDMLMLGFAAQFAAADGNNISAAIDVASIARKRRTAVNPSEVFDGYGSGVRPLSMLTLLEADCYDLAAIRLGSLEHGKRAVALYDAVTKMSGVRESVRKFATMRRDGLLARRFMRGR